MGQGPYIDAEELSVEDLLLRLDQMPETIRAAVRNNAGGHVNHHFQALFTDAATKHFGSGWAFLVVNPSRRRLEIVSLPDQDTVTAHGTPGLLCCDVWEHAYYLKYRNRRPDYLGAWWKVVAWDAVDERLRDAMAGAR